MKLRCEPGRLLVVLLLSIFSLSGWAIESFNSLDYTIPTVDRSTPDFDVDSNSFKRFPRIVDSNNMRDLFFFPDGKGRGRVVHMRMPTDYFSPEYEAHAQRYRSVLAFRILYPDMKGFSNPEVVERINAGEFTIPNGFMKAVMVGDLPLLLDGHVDELLESFTSVGTTKSELSIESLPVPEGFADPSCEKCTRVGFRGIVKHRNSRPLFRDALKGETIEAFVERDVNGRVSRLMWCFDKRAAACSIELRSSAMNVPYIFDVDFFKINLDVVSDIVERVDAKIKEFFVEVL